MKKMIRAFLALALCATAATAQMISVTPRDQEEINWDWAAVTQMILDNYGVYVTQSAIAAYATPNQPNSGVQIFGDLATRISVATTLTHFAGISSTQYSRPLTLAEITTQISTGHLVVAVAPAGFVLINGVSGNTLFYVCPWPGYGNMSLDYASFVADGGYPWSASLVLTTLPGTRPTRPITESLVPKTMPIYGFDKIWVNDGVMVYNDPTTTTTYAPVGSSWRTSLTNTSGTYGITLGASSKVGSASTSGPLFARSYAWVQGKVTMNNITQLTQQNNFVYGSLTQGTVPYQGFASGTIDFTGVAQNYVNIEPNQALQTLKPGKYWSYNIKTNSPVKLTAGDYYFHDLSCDVCTIDVDASAGSVRVYVQSSLLWTGSLSYLAGGPQNLMLAYLGTSAFYLNGYLNGTVLVPNTDLIIGQTDKAYVGMYIGKTVTAHQYSTVRFQPFTFK